MDDLANIPQLTRTFIDLATEDEAFDEHDWMLFDSFATTYRAHCEASVEIVLDDLDGYPNIQPLVAIENAQTELDIDPRHRREALYYYSEWAYRYGAKQATDPTTPEVDSERPKPYTTIQRQTADLIESGAATLNDMVLVFQLTHEYFDETRGHPGQNPPLLEFYDRVYEAVADIVELHAPDINWNLMGGLFDNGRNMADRDTMKAVGRRMGRREVIEELRETDLTLDEWLAHHE